MRVLNENSSAGALSDTSLAYNIVATVIKQLVPQALYKLKIIIINSM